MRFKTYEHLYLLTTNEQVDSHSEYSVHLRDVQSNTLHQWNCLYIVDVQRMCAVQTGSDDCVSQSAGGADGYYCTCIASTIATLLDLCWRQFLWLEFSLRFSRCYASCFSKAGNMIRYDRNLTISGGYNVWWFLWSMFSNFWNLFFFVCFCYMYIRPTCSTRCGSWTQPMLNANCIWKSFLKYEWFPDAVSTEGGGNIASRSCTKTKIARTNQIKLFWKIRKNDTKNILRCTPCIWE